MKSYIFSCKICRTTTKFVTLRLHIKTGHLKKRFGVHRKQVFEVTLGEKVTFINVLILLTLLFFFFLERQDLRLSRTFTAFSLVLLDLFSNL